jgi:hypothetical protein
MRALLNTSDFVFILAFICPFFNIGEKSGRKALLPAEKRLKQLNGV